MGCLIKLSEYEKEKLVKNITGIFSTFYDESEEIADSY